MISLNFKKFEDVIDINIFNNKKIAINEQLPTNADFLIKELSKAINGIQIISFYKKAEHYKNIIKNEDVVVLDVFENENLIYDKTKNLIIDDYHTAKLHSMEFKEFFGSSCFYIFRSNTFKNNYLYDFDLYLQIKPLDSGISPLLDGSIVLYERDRCLFNLNYKISKEGIFYTTKEC